MVWVNLLPWRRRLLLLRLRRDGLLAVALLAVLSYAAIPLADAQWFAEQQQHKIQQLKGVNGQFEKLKARLTRLAQQKEQLSAALAASVARQQRFNAWYEFMLKLPGLLPATLWLSEITKTAETLNVTGFCLQMSEIERFRQRLHSLALFAQVKNGRIGHDGQGAIRFSLVLALEQKGGGDD